MPGESPLVVIALTPAEAAEAVRRAWDRGQAVAVVDPKIPRARLDSMIEVLQPSHVVDGSGWRAVDGGRPLDGEVAAVVTTSGTTAEPRYVVLGRDAMAASARAVGTALDLAPDEDRWLVCVPLHHVAGLAIVARSYFSATPMTVHPSFDVGAVATAAGRCTLVSVVPTMLTRLVDAGAPLRLFRHMLVGGAPVAPALVEQAAHAGAHLATTYGLSETGGGCVHDGEPLHDVDVSVAADGEILVKGPVVMHGYHHDEAATHRAFTSDGSLRTGDLGHIDDDGRLIVVDRIKDIIVSGGVNVSPTAVEAVVGVHPKVNDVCVVGVPDHEWGERVIAFVVPTSDVDPPTLPELRAWCSERLTAAEMPREVRLVANVPRSAGGKALRRELRQSAD
jgi:o-succinylbenzoate---CoA ligase